MPGFPCQFARHHATCFLSIHYNTLFHKAKWIQGKTATRRHMITDALSKRALFAACRRQLDQCLEQLVKEMVMSQAAPIQVLIDPGDIASTPQVHKAVNLVDKRWWRRAGSIVAQTGTFALVPRLQSHGATRSFLQFHSAIFASLSVILLNCGLATGASQQVIAANEIGILEVAGDGVEDARPDGRALHAEVVAVEQIIGSHIIQSAHRLSAAIMGEYAPNHKIRHHTPHMA